MSVKKGMRARQPEKTFWQMSERIYASSFSSSFDQGRLKRDPHMAPP